LDFYLDLDVNQTASAFGSDKCGFAIVVDLADNTKYAQDDLSLTGPAAHPLLKVECSSDEQLARAATVKNAEVCFTSAKPIVAGAFVRYKGRLTASLGDPVYGTGDSPVFNVLDCNPYRDTDGDIKWGYYDAGFTDVGETNSKLVIRIT